MTMSIFDRIRRIAGANINWLLDKVEVPEQELESKIKELQETIQEGRESAAAYGATFRRLEQEYDNSKSWPNVPNRHSRPAMRPPRGGR
jgi:phage shock protein A